MCVCVCVCVCVCECECERERERERERVGGQIDRGQGRVRQVGTQAEREACSLEEREENSIVHLTSLIRTFVQFLPPSFFLLISAPSVCLCILSPALLVHD